ncbi:cytosine deaminase [Methylobrevis albus]|uniref:Cytosine deaminase n=1 Tax=Methylobrevis albus TaxID=2793297 RepID=A0A931MWW1_9HYPH|nr:cytosine deaminase [Methylobrevis albus]MBH0237953.1 cytosine deaminase [Methylobrevis albus]
MTAAPTFGFLADLPAAGYVLGNATVPACLVAAPALAADADGLARVDITVEAGKVASVLPAGTPAGDAPPRIELGGGMVWPTFVDMHTHLDKGHIWPRRRNPDGSFMGALLNVAGDREANWSAEDVAARMAFGLKCAYAHGTSLIRTHIDSVGPQHKISWPVFAEMKADWADRIELQGVALVGPDHVFDAQLMAEIVAAVKHAGGVLGGSLAVYPRSREVVATLLRLAADHGLDLDLHVDETEDPAATALRHLAEEAIAIGFPGKIVAGHCCSLARQTPEAIDATLDLVAEAGITVVSLPMCNMYLQDRHLLDDASGTGPRRTPRWRGVTLLHEMKARGIPVAVSSDNTRDPFYAYGDLDAVEVFREAVRILQLDHPFGDWPAAITTTPATALRAEQHGRIAAGAAADLVLFRARRYSELLSRPQADRTVLRAGRAIDRTLPDYAELDSLFGDAR